MLEQHHAAFCFADHNATAGLRAVCAADQLEAINAVTLGAARHVLNQLGVGSLLAFDLWELPSDVVELHLVSKRMLSSSTKKVLAVRCWTLRAASGAQTICF